MRRSFPPPAPIEAVLFDFHSTLVDQGDPYQWLDLAWAHSGRSGTPATELDPAEHEQLAGWVERMWEHVREVDPHSERDLSPQRHREIYDTLIERAPSVDTDLAHSLYEVMLENWIPYSDTVPTLAELRKRGIRTGLVSNIGIDIRDVLERGELTGLLDVIVLSYEAGAVKPAADIFQRALDALGVPPERALMVGDSWLDDAGAAALGIKTLLLPRTSGERHGLGLVLRLVD